jgi:predicted metal-dependent phosphoesterase TrpH
MALIRRLGYEAATITDHDFLSAEQVRRATAAAGELPFIPAAEFSAVYQGQTVHVLGYFLDADNTKLQQHFQKVQEVDKQVSVQYLAEFYKNDGRISIEDLASPSLHTMYSMQMVKRAARDLFENDPARSLTAFLEIQARLKMKYADFAPWPVRDVISLIHEAGGIAVLAHPGGLDEAVMRRLGFYYHEWNAIQKYRDWGLDGIETRTPVHTPSEIFFYENTAKQLGLLATSGSDCHGDDDYLGAALMGKFTDLFEDGYERLFDKWKEVQG